MTDVLKFLPVVLVVFIVVTLVAAAANFIALTAPAPSTPATGRVSVTVGEPAAATLTGEVSVRVA